MQNTSIPNALSPLGTTPAKPRSPDSNNGADQQFTQMLSRQMNQHAAERNAIKTPAKTTEIPKQVAAKTQPAPKEVDQSSDATVSATPAPVDDTKAGTGTTSNASSASSVETKDKSRSADKAVDGVATVAISSTDAALNASAAIMAMVANAGRTDVPKADTTPAAPTAGVRDIASRTDLRATPELALNETAIKDLAAKATGEFGAALQKAGTEQADSELAPAPASTLTQLADLPAAGSILPQAQQNMVAMAATPGVPHPGNALQPPVGGNGWDQTLGQRMVWMVAGAEQSASLTLNPPDLGPLQVVLNVSNGQADASFFSAQPEVRQALEAALPKLREMLGDAGISLGQASVSSGNPEQARGSQRNDSGARRNGASSSGSDAPASLPTRRISSSGNGIVDTFA